MTNHTIFKAKTQISPAPRDVVICAVCADHIPKTETTAGPYGADGQLMLVCNRHLRNTRQLINMLADYITVERLHFLEDNGALSEVAPDAWFLY